MAGQQRKLALVQSRLRFGGLHRVPYRCLGFARLPTVEGASEVVRGFSLWATRCGKLCTSGLESHNVAGLRDGWQERNIFDGLTWGCVEGADVGGDALIPCAPCEGRGYFPVRYGVDRLECGSCAGRGQVEPDPEPPVKAEPEPDELEAIMRRLERNERRLESRRRQAARRKAATEQPPRQPLTWAVLRERQRPSRAKPVTNPGLCILEDEKRLKSILEPIQDQS